MPDPDPGQPDRNDRDNRRTPPPPPPPPMKLNRGVFGWLLLIGLAVMLFVLLQGNQKAKKVNYGELLAHVKSNQVTKIVIKDDQILATLKEDVPDRPPGGQVSFPLLPGSRSETYINDMKELAPEILTQEPNSQFLFILLQMLPWLSGSSSSGRCGRAAVAWACSARSAGRATSSSPRN
jgi:hypothetical protein